MVFRNLRERFGIDDQDYQVRDVFAAAEGSGSGVGPGSRRTREPQDWSAILTLRLPVLSGPTWRSFPLGLAGSCRGEGPGSGSKTASKAQAVSLGGRGTGGRGLPKPLHLSLTLPV